MTYEELMEYWQTQKPQGRQQGKTIWLMIAKALEKQIPKKPIMRIVESYYEDFSDDEECECPICGSIIGMNFIPKYCCECGQKLQTEEELYWSDEK